MFRRTGLITFIVSGFFAAHAEADGCGNTTIHYLPAPVACNNCPPVVHAPIVHAPVVQTPACNPCELPGASMDPLPMHAGPAFPNRSAEAPMGRDADGARITQVLPFEEKAYTTSGPSYNVQRFLKDLLSSDGKVKIPTDVQVDGKQATKQDILEGKVDTEDLDRILAKHYSEN